MGWVKIRQTLARNTFDKEISNKMKPIFLTGLPRSGTTWASRAIVAATKGRLVHEPFNWKRYPERISYHMKYIPAGSEDAELMRILHKEMAPRFFFLRNRRIVIKDVHTCLAIEYLWDELDPIIIILVRHPCAVANSWARLGLEARSRLDILLSQEELVQTYLASFKHHINSNYDYFFQIGAYWGAAYFVLSRLTETDEPEKWQYTLTMEQIQAVQDGASPFGVFEMFYNTKSV